MVRRTHVERERLLLNVKLQVGQQWSLIAHLSEKEQIRRVQTQLLQIYPSVYQGEYKMNLAHKDASRIVKDVSKAYQGGLDPFKQLDSNETMPHDVKYVEEEE